MFNSSTIKSSIVELCFVVIQTFTTHMENYHILELIGEGSFGKVHKVNC